MLIANNRNYFKANYTRLDNLRPNQICRSHTLTAQFINMDEAASNCDEQVCWQYSNGELSESRKPNIKEKKSTIAADRRQKDYLSAQ